MKIKSHLFCRYLMILALLMFQSCKNRLGEDDPENGPSYEISGHLYEDCFMQPMTNKEIELYQALKINWDNSTKGGVLATTTTDADGYFKFVFKDKGGGVESIQYQAGFGYNEIYESIPNRTSFENLVIFNNPTTNIQVCLNVISSHSSGDTLNITDFRTNQWMRIPGPFSSGSLYTKTNYTLLGMYHGFETLFVRWYWNSDHQNYKDVNFLVNKFCNDTVFVTVDIN